MIDDRHEPLSETIELHRFETAASAASRAAALDGMGNARRFCWAYLLNFEKIALGDEKQIRALARLLSVDADELVKWSPVKAGQSKFRLNGELFTTGRSRRTRLRGCIMCFKEQMAAAPNLSLDAALASMAPALLDPIRTCFIHGASYVQLADESVTGEHHHDHALITMPALDDWDDLEAATVMRPASRFEMYLLGRIGASERLHIPLLDPLSITDVTKICERMGMFELHGRKALHGDVDEHGLYYAADAGFRVLERGEDGVRDFVTRAHEKADADGLEGLSSTIFDRFHYFLNSEAAISQFLEIKQIIIDRLSELVPYGPDDPIVFGVRPAKRHWHSLISAERQYGVAYRTIQARVERVGIFRRLNPAFEKSRYVISADDLERMMLGDDQAITQLEVVQRTGIDTLDMATIKTAGVLVPTIHSDLARDCWYRRGDVLDLERMFRSLAVEQHGEVEGMVTVYRGYRDTNWTRGEVLRHMADGKVPISMVAGLRSLESLRVNLEELAKLHPLYGREIMTTEPAAKLLCVSEAVIQKLILTDSIRWDYVRIKKSGKLKKAVFRDGVEEFKRNYIPLSEVVKTYRVSHIQCRGWLAGIGVQEQFTGLDLRCTFYLRKEVDRLVPGAPRPVRKPLDPFRRRKHKVIPLK